MAGDRYRHHALASFGLTGPFEDRHTKSIILTWEQPSFARPAAHDPRPGRGSARRPYPLHQREADMFNDDHLNYAEKTSSLIQLDSLIPYQYGETVQRRIHLQAEKRLMLAILEDAIFCFQRYLGAQRRKEQRLFEETEAWIMDPEGSWIFSFESVCQSLQLDPSYVRRGLLEWKRSRTGRTPVDPETPGCGKNRSQKTRLRFAA